MPNKYRGATLTILAILLAVMVITNLHKPFAHHPGEGFVFFGTRLSGAANTIVAPTFAIMLAVYVYGILAMRKFALPLGIVYAAYVIINMPLFILRYHGTPVLQEHSWAYLVPLPLRRNRSVIGRSVAAIPPQIRFAMRLFDSSRHRAIEDFRAYAAKLAIAFKDLEAIEENASRLSILDPLLAGKRFAYIGESDHFIHEKYAYRLAMLNYLAGRGFTHLGEELGASDGMRIARFVATGDESQLERVTIYGYAGAARHDRDDTPTGILRDSFGDAYPTALFAAEQKRFARGLRKVGVRFFGFDIDPLPGGGYEDLAEILDSMPVDATVDRIRNALQRVPDETIDQEIARLDVALQLIEAHGLDALRYAATCLRDSFDYVRITYPAKTFDALNPGMAFRERYMHRQVDRMLGQMRANEKLALMSHNMHLCRAPDAVAGSNSGAGPGGKTDPPLGAWLAARYPGEIFSVWMLIGRGQDSQPFPTLSKEIREKTGTLNTLLAEIGDCFVLPIDPSDTRARLLTENIEIMHDGNGGVRTAIARQADAIFFVRDVTPLRA